MKSYLLASLLFIRILSLSPFVFGEANPGTDHFEETIYDQQDLEETPDDELFEDEVEEELPPLQHNQKPGAYPIENHLDFPGLDEAWHSHISHETESFESKFLHMLLVLGLLIGFMFVASWALKRMMKAKITHHNTSSSIKVLETRYLSPRATLYLVEIEGQSLLIAESPTAVTYLKTFRLHDEETEEVEPTHHFPSQEQPTI